MGTRAEQQNQTEQHHHRQKVRLKVLYDFEYETRGKPIKIVKDEKLVLLKKTNDDWWQVVRPADINNFYVPEQSTFYVPTGYVTEIQEEQLPESTRFYVDKDKMFNQQPPQSVQQQQTTTQSEKSPQESRKAHDSFRNVFRKLSGNLGSANNDSSSSSSSGKPPKQSSKIVRNLRKNSVDNSEKSVIKHKDAWESSAFGMCFGRDMKNADAQMLNPFQEELENALSSRVSQRRTIFDNSKLEISKPLQEKVIDENDKTAAKFENIHDKWAKVSASVKKNKESNFQYVPLSKIKEDAQKRRSASPNYQKNDTLGSNHSSGSNASSGVRRISESEKLYSVVEKSPKTQKKPEPPSKPESKPVTVKEPEENIDRLLINDKRKMWAIETLMSELMQSSSSAKPPLSPNTNEKVSGPNQLAEELHEMNASRRYENAEIQVNLLDNADTKETDSCKRKKSSKIFDFPPRASVARSPTARSPKLLDEYNEANILNDNDKLRGIQDENPSYSNISLRIRRDKVPCKLKMPTKDFRDELQLTPSLEKLASEIKFLPASANSTENENEKFSLDLDCPTTTLSQDSLRLYKRRSKSDGALNKRDPRRRDSVNSQRTPTSSSHMEIFKVKEQQSSLHHIERKYAQHETQQRYSLKHEIITTTQDYHLRSERVSQTTRYKLNRKSRSLGDLDCSEMDEKKGDDEGDINSSYEIESRRRYKPVPKLRSKESLRRIKPSIPVVTSTTSVERLPTRPIPAKRRNILPSQSPQQPHNLADSSYDDLSEIDIERSTAVGFKALLRTSDSGSEEYLQYKTFPVTSSANSSMGRSIEGNANLSRSLSDEAILSSTSCSNSESPSRMLDTGSVENLVDLPPGWTQSYDRNAKRVCFVNERGDKWFSSNDAEGKIYFFEENSNESSWALPSVTSETRRVRTLSNGDWPQLFDGNMCILKEGVINKTKITTENGKKLRKTWSSSYAVLTELFLLFFKDAKTFAAMKMDQSAAAKPDITVDLNGAFIEPADKLSNRKNVYLINTLLGLQVLIQSDNALVIAEWYREIHVAIQRLPFSQEYARSSSTRE